MPAVRNQGNRGTCVAFCLTAIHEFDTRRASKHDFSERYLYYKAKAIDGTPADCGTFQSAAAQVLDSSGQCTETVWQYNPTDTCNDHGALPPKANADAAEHTLSLTALNPHDLIAIKTALAAGRPVGISIPVYVSWYQSPTTERTGRITMPIGSEHDIGGHCMCIVGYQDDGPETVTETPGGGFFILRNSWGTTWGRDCAFGAGYGTIPYGYIAALNWESYTRPAPTKKKGKKRQIRRKSSKNVRRTARASAAKRTR
jgi:C1A family cysteine protease